MSFFESILYGLISGLTEFIPVSSLGHQAMLLKLFGLETREPVRDIFVHIGILLSLLMSSKTLFNHLQREQELADQGRTRHRSERRGAYDLQLIKMAIFPMIAGLLLYFSTKKLEQNMVLLAIFFVINGIILIVPEYIRHGNKDARFMNGWDGIMLGLLGATTAIPGVSRVAAISMYSTSRGVDRSNALNWMLVLSIPALLIFMGFDIVNLFLLPLGTITISTILMYLVSTIAAFCGGYFGVLSMRYLAVHTGYAGFAYYSWGAAMFTFVLYLIA